jgi:hypothetical protein
VLSKVLRIHFGLYAMTRSSDKRQHVAEPATRTYSPWSRSGIDASIFLDEVSMTSRILAQFNIVTQRTSLSNIAGMPLRAGHATRPSRKLEDDKMLLNGSLIQILYEPVPNRFEVTLI